MRKIKTHILIFGATGMLGRALYNEGKKRKLNIVGVSRSGPDYNIDLLNKNKITELINYLRPEIILNSAAIISHSLCEKDPKLAKAINSEAVSIISSSANKIGAKLVQISTDNYFTGDGNKLHSETDPVKLLSNYSKTKFEGERFALNSVDAIVIRTNITGFRTEETSLSFIEWIISAAKSKKRFVLFDDYYASTISTYQAASIIFDIMNLNFTGIINIASREVTSKKNFAETFAEKASLSLDFAETTSVHNVLSGRAESVGLDVSLAESILNYKLPDLNEVINQLANEYWKLSS